MKYLILHTAKKLLLNKICFFFVAYLFINFNLQAQCSADTNLKTPGFKPDTIPHAIENKAYTQVIQFKFPKDTALFGTTVIFDSLTIKSITNLPTNITWQCGQTDCTYLGGGNGCLTLSGTPPTGSAGKYNMLITVTAHFPLPAPLAYKHQDFPSTWNFFVDGSSAIIEPAPTANFTATPNPFDHQVIIEMSGLTTQQSHLQIFNMQGKEVSNMNIQVAQENNKYNIDTKSWNPGLYIIKTNGAFAGKIVKM